MYERGPASRQVIRLSAGQWPYCPLAASVAAWRSVRRVSPPSSVSGKKTVWPVKPE